jgi:hypothetical protein
MKNGSSHSNNSPTANSAPAPTVTMPLPVPLPTTSFHVTSISAGRSHSMIIAKETYTIVVDPIEGSLNPNPTKVVTKNLVYCWGKCCSWSFSHWILEFKMLWNIEFIPTPFLTRWYSMILHLRLVLINRTQVIVIRVNAGF